MLRRLLTLLVLLTLSGSKSLAEDVRSGVWVEYASQDSTLVNSSFSSEVRSSLQFTWDHGSPHLTMPVGAFEAVMRSSLLIADGEKVRFSLYLRGNARLYIGEKLVVQGERSDTGWVKGQWLSLSEGYNPLKLEYLSLQDAKGSLVRVFWESSEFPVEPILGQVLNLPENIPQLEKAKQFERGQRLVRELNCSACHQIPGGGVNSFSVPNLFHSASVLTKAQFLNKVQLGSHSSIRESTMPQFYLSKEEGEELFKRIKVFSKKAQPSEKLSSKELKKVSAQRGKSLVLKRGCLACHSLSGEELQRQSLGSDLSQIQKGRSEAQWARWLKGSFDLKRKQGHYPQLKLSKEERFSLAKYLIELGKVNKSKPDEGKNFKYFGESKIVPSFSYLIFRSCGGCHTEFRDHESYNSIPIKKNNLDSSRKWEASKSCAQDPSVALGKGKRTHLLIPTYRVSKEDLAAIEIYISNVHRQSQVSHSRQGERIFQESGCQSCHQRGTGSNFSQLHQKVSALDKSLRGKEGLLKPPSLDSIGEKLRGDELNKAVHGNQDRRRSWLEVRMPRYTHSALESKQLVAFFEDHDSIPQGYEDPNPNTAQPENLYRVGHQLLGAQGFSCSSCHGLGEYEPQSVEVGVRGPNLVGLGQKMNLDWFKRWMRNPARRASGIEMPSITDPYPKLLNEDLDLQFEAMWAALNSPHFTAPAATKVERVVSAGSGIGVWGPNTRVIHDVFKLHGAYGDSWLARAFAIASNDQQNLLYDLDHFSAIAWYSGSLARQRTQGKTWFWEVGGLPILPKLPHIPAISLIDKADNVQLPRVIRTTRGWLKRWQQKERGVELEYELHFSPDTKVTVVEELETLGLDKTRGISRRFRVDTSSIDANSSAIARVFLPKSSKGSSLSPFQSIEAGSLQGKIRFDAKESGRWYRHQKPEKEISKEIDVFHLTGSSNGGSHHFHWVQYLVEEQNFPAGTVTTESTERTKAQELDTVPGYQVKRLPLHEKLMPTAFGFSESDEVYLTTLNGQVRKLLDTDGDGLEDRSIVVAESLSAPYGILVEGKDLIVSHKSALLKLSDLDGNDYFESTQVIATGWGFNDNYHDWVVGVLKNGNNYLLTLGSDYQQGGRPRNETMFRGKAISVTPHGEINEFASGLRFPMGIAKNEDGHFFFTDNQGNGNPFNEFNHLVEGKNYGLPSLYDSTERKKIIGHATPPAVQLPHPWTRSTNGICFLTSDPKYGAFKSHALGADYDTKKLTRISLQKIGDTYQGACYPFSLPKAGSEGFLGPLSIARSPSGAIYLGNMKDSGWGGGNNIGTICKLIPGELPPGLAEIKATQLGFELSFTQKVDSKKAADVSNYSLSAYRRPYKGGYGTAITDRHEVKVSEAKVDSTSNRVLLKVTPYRAGYLYEIRLKNLSSSDQIFWPSEGYFSLHQIP